MPLNKSWHDYNESLIERGRILIDVSFIKSSNKEIKKMNIGKVGAPFQYSDSYVRFLAFLKIGLRIPYRMVQGIVRGLAEYVKIVEEIHFTHIRKNPTLALVDTDLSSDDSISSSGFIIYLCDKKNKNEKDTLHRNPLFSKRNQTSLIVENDVNVPMGIVTLTATTILVHQQQIRFYR